MEIINVCLSDIPKVKLKLADNGKIYTSLVVSKKKQVDQFDNDLNVAMSKTKEERELGSETVWVGSGKTINPPVNTQSVEEMAEVPAEMLNDLPY